MAAITDAAATATDASVQQLKLDSLSGLRLWGPIPNSPSAIDLCSAIHCQLRVFCSASLYPSSASSRSAVHWTAILQSRYWATARITEEMKSFWPLSEQISDSISLIPLLLHHSKLKLCSGLEDGKRRLRGVEGNELGRWCGCRNSNNPTN